MSAHAQASPSPTHPGPPHTRAPAPAHLQDIYWYPCEGVLYLDAHTHTHTHTHRQTHTQTGHLTHDGRMRCFTGLLLRCLWRRRRMPTRAAGGAASRVRRLGGGGRLHQPGSALPPQQRRGARARRLPVGRGGEARGHERETAEEGWQESW